MEHHANLGAQQSHVFLAGEQVFAVQNDLAFGALLGVELKHAVKHPQQGRFAAARRADEGGDFAFRNIEVDALEGVELAVVKVQVLDGNLGVHGAGISFEHGSTR